MGLHRLRLVGCGTGNPAHLTLEAIGALRGADLVLIPRKGPDKADLADLRRAICAAHLPDMARVAEFDMPVRDRALPYLAAVDAWHAATARDWARVLADRLPQGGEAALLVWGDPSLYDSTLRIAGRLGLGVSVVPGITSLQVLCAAHAIPLNDLGAPVVITTGRRLRDQGWPPGADTVAVMLDAGGAWAGLKPEGVTLWWGACLGLPQQALVAGPLTEAGPRALAERARVRAELGWVMDVYLLRRSSQG
jgi:precorrin-6A synthase